MAKTTTRSKSKKKLQDVIESIPEDGVSAVAQVADDDQAPKFVEADAAPDDDGDDDAPKTPSDDDKIGSRTFFDGRKLPSLPSPSSSPIPSSENAWKASYTP